MPINATRSSTKEQHDAAIVNLIQKSPDHVILHESPASDVKPAEELLGLEEGTLPNFILRFEKADKHCTQCGRYFSVLDLINTALKTHSKEFLKEVIFREEFTHGNGGQIPACYRCGKYSGSAMAYGTSTYSC